MFANLRTKGFNLEDTCIADPGKLSTLPPVLALTATPRVKTGVAALQKTAASAKPAQVIAFLHQIPSPTLLADQLKSMAI
ncbi:MAG: hypothetical protein ACT4O2_10750 [Beijerinckiaceae bacterium]